MQAHKTTESCRQRIGTLLFSLPLVHSLMWLTHKPVKIASGQTDSEAFSANLCWAFLHAPGERQRALWLSQFVNAVLLLTPKHQISGQLGTGNLRGFRGEGPRAAFWLLCRWGQSNSRRSARLSFHSLEKSPDLKGKQPSSPAMQHAMLHFAREKFLHRCGVPCTIGPENKGGTSQ